MRAGLLETLLVVGLVLPGCSGGSGDDDDGGAGDGDGNSGSVGVVEIDTVSPNHGPLMGGTLITITGKGFLLGNAQPDSVLVGGVQCETIQLIDDQTMKVETPPGDAPGTVDVIVFNSNGYDTAAGAYSYNPVPTVTLVTEDNGPAGGGETVTITGTGFQNLEAGTNLVFFGENQAGDVTVSSDTSMTVTSPPGEAFTLVDVAVVNDNGAAEKPHAYEYNSAGDTIIALGRNGSSGCGCDMAGKPGYFGTPYAAPLLVTTLFSVDPETGAVASIAEAETWINGLARAPSGIMYGVIHASRAPEDIAGQLVTVDIATGAIAPVGSTGQTSPINDISFVGSVLFGVAHQAGSSGGIHTLNTTTGAATGIGGYNLTSGGNGLVYDGTKLYNANNGGLCEVNTANGTVDNCVGDTNRRVRALTMANGEMYGATNNYWDDGSVLLRFDRVTGAVAEVVAIPGKVTALATVP